MSKFNSYAKKADQIAKAAFEEYRKAEKALTDAQAALDKTPEYKLGMSSELHTYQYQAERAAKQDALMKAKENFTRAKSQYEKHLDEIKALRNDLEADVNSFYAADPAALDNNTLELLKSGILKNSDYQKLMDKAESEANYTMIRMIAKYAGEAAEAEAKRSSDHDPKAMELRAISYKARQCDGKDTLDAFDVMTDVYSRSINNPAMIDQWDRLTGDIVENL